MAALPTTCKAACVHEHGQKFKLLIEDVPCPTPDNGEILVRLSVTGLCYSDVHYMLEDLPMPKMRDFDVRSPGHEGVGRVVSVGAGATNWTVGDRVGVKPIWSTCRNCHLCCGDREMFCPSALQTGIHKPGTYQQYLVASADHAIRIPDGVKDHIAAPILCSGATIYRALSESRVKSGEWIVISGAGGGVGHMGVQYARAMGMRVIAVDGGPEKAEFCLSLGAVAYIDFTKVKSIAAEVVRYTGGLGAHGVFVTTGNPAAYRNLPEMLRIGGVIMCIGLPPAGTADAGGDPIPIIGKNLTLTGTLVGTQQDVIKALDFVEQGLVNPVVETYDLEDIQLAVDKLRRGDVKGRSVVVFK